MSFPVIEIVRRCKANLSFSIVFTLKFPSNWFEVAVAVGVDYTLVIGVKIVHSFVTFLHK